MSTTTDQPPDEAVRHDALPDATGRAQGSGAHTRIDPGRRKIGRRIAALRKELGLSVDDVGAYLGVTGNAALQWETGRTSPSPANFDRLCSLLGCEHEYLQIGYDPDDYRRAQTDIEVQILLALRAISAPARKLILIQAKAWASEELQEERLPSGISGTTR